MVRMRSWRAWCFAVCLLLFAFGKPAIANPPDPLLTESRLPPSALPLIDEDAPIICAFDELSGTLQLPEAIERALCQSPDSRAAWAQARIQAAQLGIARSAYLPNLSANVGYLAQTTSNTYEKPYDVLDAKTQPRTRTANLKLSWTIADTGLRKANVEQAAALLDAANASHDRTIQRTLLETAQRYFDAQTALAVLRASEEAERSAQKNLDATTAKHAAGAGALTDKLQAAVALSDARLKRVSAQGELENATGSLATSIGLSPKTRLLLPERDQTLPEARFGMSIDDLFDQAGNHHPSLRAARAELNAAMARVRAVRAEGRPVLGFSAEASERRQDKHIPISGYPATGAVFRDNVVGMQLSIPLFEGFGRGYKVRAANSQVEQLQAELGKIEQQVMLDVWKNYQALNTRKAHIEAAQTLLESARRSYEVAEGRFRAGVGSILELLGAQSAVANAEQRRIEALSGWLSARLQLAASIGKLGVWAIR